MRAVFTPTRYKLSVEEYHRVGEAGILGEDSRVELIDGELMEWAPIGAAHMRVLSRLNRASSPAPARGPTVREERTDERR